MHAVSEWSGLISKRYKSQGGRERQVCINQKEKKAKPTNPEFARANCIYRVVYICEYINEFRELWNLSADKRVNWSFYDGKPGSSRARARRARQNALYSCIGSKAPLTRHFITVFTRLFISERRLKTGICAQYEV